MIMIMLMMMYIIAITCQVYGLWAPISHLSARYDRPTTIRLSHLKAGCLKKKCIFADFVKRKGSRKIHRTWGWFLMNIALSYILRYLIRYAPICLQNSLGEEGALSQQENTIFLRWLPLPPLSFTVKRPIDDDGYHGYYFTIIITLQQQPTTIIPKHVTRSANHDHRCQSYKFFNHVTWSS